MKVSKLEGENRSLKSRLLLVDTQLRAIEQNEKTRDATVKKAERAEEISYWKRQTEYYQQVVQRVTGQVDEMTAKMFGETKGGKQARAERPVENK